MFISPLSVFERCERRRFSKNEKKTRKKGMERFVDLSNLYTLLT